MEKKKKSGRKKNPKLKKKTVARRKKRKSAVKQKKIVSALKRKKPVLRLSAKTGLAQITPKQSISKKIRLEREPESDEVTLDKSAMRIYLQQIESISLLTPEEEISLAKTAESNSIHADAARQKMIRSNLRLVISIAKRYANLGLPFSDLVEEGNIGLMRAVDKFNHERGYRFSTYASWWIKQAIMRALSNQGKTIRLPVYMYDIVLKFRKTREALVQRLHRTPTRKEISDALDIPIRKIKEIERIISQPSSLNAPVSIDGAAEVIDMIQDESSLSPGDSIDQLFEGQRIDQLLGWTDDREKQILVLRFGLKGAEPKTLEEVAKEFGVTRERIRQIELAALNKIRGHLERREEKVEDYVRKS